MRDYQEFLKTGTSEDAIIQWILENGHPEIQYMYERVGVVVYRRISRSTINLPPWLDTTLRKPIS